MPYGDCFSQSINLCLLRLNFRSLPLKAFSAPTRTVAVSTCLESRGGRVFALSPVYQKAVLEARGLYPIFLVTMKPKSTDVVLGGQSTPPVTLGTMDIDRAREIVRQCFAVSMSKMDFEEYKGAKLPACSLEEMLIANRIVKDSKPTINPDGTRSHMMHVADRGVAADYALENFGIYALLEALGFEFDDDE